MGAEPAQGLFDDFYRTTSRRVVHHVYAMTGNLAEAQDCVQEAYARAWQRWSRVGGLSDPEAWVRTVARRIAVSRWRRTVVSARHLRGQRDEPVTDAPSENHPLLVDALRQLPPAQREAIVLHHLVGLPVAAVAAETGVPEGTVKARLHRGRAALAEIIGPLDAPVEARTEPRHGR